jgi:hypothetical protein
MVNSFSFFAARATLFFDGADSHDMTISMMNVTQIQRRIAQLQQQLPELGPLHPGSISEQYNVCGNPAAAAKTPRSRRSTIPIIS